MRVLVTGASRGIGLELVRALLARGHEVEALVRSRHDELARLARSEPLSALTVDLTDPGAESAIRGWHRDRELDVLINNAGGYDPDARPFAEGGQPLADVTVEDALAVYHLNAVAPMMVARACLPRLAPTGTIVNVTSLIGTRTGARRGGQYLYGPSKAALNWITVAMARDLAPRTVFAITPGWVRTRTGGEGAPRDASTAAADLLAVILNGGPERSGLVVDEHGEPMD